MSDNGRVLLYCPTFEHQGKLAIREETQACIDALEWGGTLDVIIDSSQPHHPYDPADLYHSHENTLLKYQKARRLTLEGGYDALFIVEHDMLIPANALQKLWAVRGDVVYGAYMFRNGNPTLNLLRWTNTRSIDQSMQFYPEDIRYARAQVVFRVSGAGFGCTLIRRSALEQVEMRGNRGGHPAPDMPFAEDCERAGIVQMGHFGVTCGHIRPDGFVLWPGRESEPMGYVKVKIIENFNANIGGETWRLREGQETAMPEAEAREYSRAGLLELIGAVEVKVINPPFNKAGKAVKVRK
jgi:hypothetical protein